MRIAALLAAAAALAPGLVQAQDRHEAHPERTFSMVRAEAGWTRHDGEDVIGWDADAWIGGDRNKAWLKTEGELESGRVESAKAEALWSRALGTFWDLQAGVRQDFEPGSTSYLALGLHGLARYQFETEAFAYLSDEGELSARLEHGLELHLTQDLILEPELELEASAADAPERGVGAGLSALGVSLQLRYEITRKFAPYVELAYERRLGETAILARAAGEDAEEARLKAGLRTWF